MVGGMTLSARLEAAVCDGEFEGVLEAAIDDYAETDDLFGHFMEWFGDVDVVEEILETLDEELQDWDDSGLDEGVFSPSSERDKIRRRKAIDKKIRIAKKKAKKVAIFSKKFAKQAGRSARKTFKAAKREKKRFMRDVKKHGKAGASARFAGRAAWAGTRAGGRLAGKGLRASGRVAGRAAGRAGKAGMKMVFGRWVKI